MKVNFQCVNCSQPYSVDASHGGKLIQCRACHTQVRIPQLNSEPSVAVNATAAKPATLNAASSSDSSVAESTDLDDTGEPFPTELEKMVSKNLQYSRLATIPAIQKDLEMLRKFDKHHETKKTKFLYLLCGSLFASLVFGAASYFLIVDGISALGIGSILATLAGVTSAVVTGISYAKHARLDLEDKRYECMNEFLRLIAVDAGDDAFRIKLDFGKHNRRDTYLRSGSVGHWDVKFYANDWFTVTGKLKDGSRFTISIKEKHQDRSRWKRSRSGKSKHKSKVKTSEEITLVIRPKEKRYPDLVKLVPDAPKALQIPKYADLKSFSFQQQAIVLKLAVRQSCIWQSSLEGEKSVQRQVKERVNLLAMMLLSVYQMLNLSRELQKNAG